MRFTNSLSLSPLMMTSSPWMIWFSTANGPHPKSYHFLHQVMRCAIYLITSIFKRKISLSTQCCHALSTILDDCLYKKIHTLQEGIIFPKQSKEVIINRIMQTLFFFLGGGGGGEEEGSFSLIYIGFCSYTFN